MEYDSYRLIAVVNQSGEEVPAFAVMEVIETDLEETAYIQKPTVDSQKLIMINGPSVIPIDGSGSGTIDMPYWVYYNSADGTPAAGEQWGAKAGSWKIHKGKLGFLTIPMKSPALPPLEDVVMVKFEECRS